MNSGTPKNQLKTVTSTNRVENDIKWDNTRASKTKHNDTRTLSIIYVNEGHHGILYVHIVWLMVCLMRFYGHAHMYRGLFGEG
jgi:hypothetical protein